MIDTIYVESQAEDHPRTQEILRRFANARRISCDRYGEVFNRRSQDFRLQKQNPALIIAAKHDNFVLEAPSGFGIGGTRNYYFSHMLNCIYDCRYCFLQGMYTSANYVLFVNYEDFADEIHRLAHATPETCYFFSGYDCDSLALDPVSRFVEHVIPVFADLPDSWLELRTKSTQVRGLLAQTALPNCVVAFSLSPEPVAVSIEHKTPGLAARLDAASRLQARGWPIGLRFDPVLHYDGCEDDYRKMFAQTFAAIDPGTVHSVSLGAFRMPVSFFRKAERLYPDEELYCRVLPESDGIVSYPPDETRRMLEFCRDQITEHVEASKLFACSDDFQSLT
jgi:spore photoproduct lyase